MSFPFTQRHQSRSTSRQAPIPCSFTATLVKDFSLQGPACSYWNNSAPGEVPAAEIPDILVPAPAEGAEEHSWDQLAARSSPEQPEHGCSSHPTLVRSGLRLQHARNRANAGDLAPQTQQILLLNAFRRRRWQKR